MNIIISKASLSKAITSASKAVSTNTAIPILSGILLRAEEGVLELQSTNIDQSIRIKVAANVEEPGDAVVSGKVLANIVKSLPDEAVTIESSGTTATIKCGRAKFRLNTLDPKDFPEFPKAEPEASATIRCALLSDMVDRVYKMTSKDKSRPILSGIKLDIEGGMVRLVATDSYRLAVCDAGIDFEGEFSALVPGNVFHDVMGMASMVDEVTISTTSRQVIFEFGNVTYVTRFIEGNFPNYKQLLPKSCNTSVRLDRSIFTAALKRVSIMASSTQSVRFDVSGDTMDMYASTPDEGESSEQVEVETDGQPVTIALNGKFVAETMAACGDEVVLELTTSVQPAVFKSYGTVNYLCLCMPVRI